jgi:hypothetical protein
MTLHDSLDAREAECRAQLREARRQLRYWNHELRSVIRERIAAWPGWTDSIRVSIPELMEDEPTEADRGW